MAIKSKTQLEYEKQVKRLKQFERRALKRGYRFDESIIPQKEETESARKYVNRLKKLTPTKLYEKATAWSEEIGDVVSGAERRREERKEASRKAYETRKKKLKEVSVNEPHFDSKRAKQDQQEKEKLKDKSYSNQLKAGRIVYDRILQMISDATDTKRHKRSADYLTRFLEEQITQYGFDTVMKSLAESPSEAIENAMYALRYEPGSAKHTEAINALLRLISGEIPTAEQSKDIQDMEDEYDDFEGE